MKSELAANIDLMYEYQALTYCKNCKYYEGKCTKKVAIRVCKKENIKVKVKSTSIFGGVSEDQKRSEKEGTHTIYINATCLFGGVEIK